MSEQANKIEISLLTNENSSAAFALVCQRFVEDSVLHKAVGVSLAEYREYLSYSFEIMRQQGLSVVATDRVSNEVVGCLIACDYAIEVQASTQMPECIRPVAALLQSLDALYRNQRQIVSGDYLLVDMAVVSSEACGQGLYRKLRTFVHQHGCNAGFKWVVGELSSAATQRVCVADFGHKICAEIDYRSFEYSGQRPFSTISDPRSILLVEGELKPSGV